MIRLRSVKREAEEHEVLKECGAIDTFLVRALPESPCGSTGAFNDRRLHSIIREFAVKSKRQ